jgi:hypothetical protein
LEHEHVALVAVLASSKRFLREPATDPEVATEVAACVDEVVRLLEFMSKRSAAGLRHRVRVRAVQAAVAAFGTVGSPAHKRRIAQLLAALRLST